MDNRPVVYTRLRLRRQEYRERKVLRECKDLNQRLRAWDGKTKGYRWYADVSEGKLVAKGRSRAEEIEADKAVLAAATARE